MGNARTTCRLDAPVKAAEQLEATSHFEILGWLQATLQRWDANYAADLSESMSRTRHSQSGHYSPSLASYARSLSSSLLRSRRRCCAWLDLRVSACSLCGIPVDSSV